MQGDLQRPLQLLILDGVVERLRGVKKTDITFSDKYDKYGQCAAAVTWRFDNISQQQNRVSESKLASFNKWRSEK